MVNKLLSMIRDYRMIRPGDRIVCAVSGGADSVALLFALYLLKEKLKITLEAAHFNHGLRGEESDRDEQFVRRFCEQYDIPLYVGSAEVKAGKKGVEAAARDARYAFLESLDGKIATAHTADDNAETVLMHMIRGTGLKGLGGISPVRGKIIRPMLLVTRQQVMDFVEEYHLQYVHDSSNDTDAFLRNRLRHQVLPLLKQENPRLSENLSVMALRLRQDEQLLSPEPVSGEGLDVAETAALPPAVRSRVLADFLKVCGIKEPNSSHVAQAEALLRSENPSAKAPFPGNVIICRRYNKLIAAAAMPQIGETELENPGITELPELGLRVHCFPAEQLRNTEDTFTVTACRPMVVRSRLQGDIIRLPGGSKSVKKLFIDRKIPADCRAAVPVVADEKGILGIYGIGANRDRIPAELPAVQIHFEHYTPKNK